MSKIMCHSAVGCGHCLNHFKITLGRGGVLQCSKYLLWTQSQWKAHVTNKETVCDLFAKKS